MQLPSVFLEKMNVLLGAEYPQWLESMEEKSFRGLRVNTSKVSVEKFEKISPFPLKRVPWVKNGFYLDENANASRHPYYAAGLYYLQEPSAMTPASCLPVSEGDRVLDLCAAPGGKATELAAKLNGTGLLVANDISNSRAKGLLKNLELFGAGNILVTSETPERLCSYFEGFFDKILIDAPCSGEGMFRREPSMVKDWLEHGPIYYAGIQKEIVEQAARMLRPGGLLIYSTCTFDPVENEGTLAHLMNVDTSFRVLELPAYEGFSPGRPDMLEGQEEFENLSAEQKISLTRAARIYPHKMKGEGHFVALLQKGEAEAFAEKKQKAKMKAGKVDPQWEQFASLLNCKMDPEQLRLYDKQLYCLPKALLDRNIRGLRFLRTGLMLGQVEKNRFEPSQALAMNLKKEEFVTVADFSSGDKRVLRYLKGETLDGEDLETAKASGWQLVCVDGYPLGWAKLINGSLRNKYYPGWRW